MVEDSFIMRFMAFLIAVFVASVLVSESVLSTCLKTDSYRRVNSIRAKVLSRCIDKHNNAYSNT